MSETKIPVLMYHDFSEFAQKSQFLSKTNKKYVLPLNIFEKHLQYLKEKGYRSIQVKELRHLDSKKDEKLVCITFDDGYKSNYDAFKLLKEYGFKGSFFVPTKFIGNAGHLSESQLVEMHEAGMEIGSHSHTHSNLKELDKKSVEEESKKSKNILENTINEEIASFSIPGGNYNEKVIDILKNSGYKNIRTSDYGYFSDTKQKDRINAITILNLPFMRTPFLFLSKLYAPLMKVLKGLKNLSTF